MSRKESAADREIKPEAEGWLHETQQNSLWEVPYRNIPAPENRRARCEEKGLKCLAQRKKKTGYFPVHEYGSSGGKLLMAQGAAMPGTLLGRAGGRPSRCLLLRSAHPVADFVSADPQVTQYRQHWDSSILVSQWHLPVWCSQETCVSLTCPVEWHSGSTVLQGSGRVTDADIPPFCSKGVRGWF